jgi:hypothetical protein
MVEHLSPTASRNSALYSFAYVPRITAIFTPTLARKIPMIHMLAKVALNSYDPHACDTYSISDTATFSANNKYIVATSNGVTYAWAAIYGA